MSKHALFAFHRKSYEYEELEAALELLELQDVLHHHENTQCAREHTCMRGLVCGNYNLEQAEQIESSLFKLVPGQAPVGAGPDLLDRAVVSLPSNSSFRLTRSSPSTTEVRAAEAMGRRVRVCGSRTIVWRCISRLDSSSLTRVQC